MRDENVQSEEAVFFQSRVSGEWRDPNDRLLRHHERTENKNKDNSGLGFDPQVKVLEACAFHLSILSIVLLKKISVCPRIFNILQPIQVHFQIALYCFTGSTNTYKINIILIPLSNPLCHCRHPFQLCILHNHEVVFLLFLNNTVLNIFILNKTLLYATFSAKSIKKNKSFYFTITYSFPIALLLFG